LRTIAEFDVVGHDCPAEFIRTRVRAWNMHKFQLTLSDDPWLRLALNGRMMTEAVSIAAQVGGQTTKSHGGQCRTFAPGAISLTDFSAPFERWSAGASVILSFRLSYAELCLPAATIRSAAGDLAASPLYELFQAHLLQLYHFVAGQVPALDRQVPPSATSSFGYATLELARAVIATVGHDDPARNDVANEALLTRIEAHVKQHLTDPALSPETIAHAHHISVRQLYKLWAARELPLAEWIMRGRLEGARHDIAKDGASGIAVIARQWGFSDATHFGRRFRNAYGLSPREWKQAHDTRDQPRSAAG
jgi:AraC-like DNA-binding protein